MSRNEYPTKIRFFSTSNRDLLQNPVMTEHGKYSLSITERLEIFEAEYNYGVRYFEVFSPVVGGLEQESLRAIIRRRNELHSEGRGYAYICAHSRLNDKDMNAAIREGVDGLNLYMPTSDELKKGTSKSGESMCIEDVRRLIEGVRHDYPNLLLRFSGEDFGRTNIEDIYRVYDEVACTVDRFGIPDTTGVMKPRNIRERVLQLRNRYPNHDLECHNHNDKGFALANTMEFIDVGMSEKSDELATFYVSASLLGLAERSGTASLTAVAFNMIDDYPSQLEGISLELSYYLNVLMSDIAGIEIPYTEPINQKNRTHQGGVHTHKMIIDPQSYEAHDWDKFGLTRSLLNLGPLSGWHIVNYYLTTVLAYTQITEEVARAITPLFKHAYSLVPTTTEPIHVLEKVAREYISLHS